MSLSVKSAQLISEISAILGDKEVDLQGWVIAELAAMWLVGHSVLDNPKATDDLRAELFACHTEAIQMLLAYYKGLPSLQ